MYVRKKQQRSPKMEWGEDSVYMYRSEALLAAKELGYDKRCLDEVRMAKTNDAIANAMARGRHRQENREE